MKKNMKIGSQPSKIHYGGAPKNPPTVMETGKTKTTDPYNISKGAQESNLKTNKPKK